MKPGIPRKTVYRLSVYMRCLEQFHENGVQTASSHSLAQAAGVKPTQLRKDLSSFGHFGTRRWGYDVERLRDKIAEVLGRERLQPVVLVGVGHLGSALLAYEIGIITVPPAVAQDVANRLIAAGVNAILNFAPVVLRVPSNVNLAIELENLGYFRSLAEG